MKEVLANPDDREEYADCFLLLLDAARREGISFTELVSIAYEKLQVNKNRTWNVPKWIYTTDYDEDGHYRCEAMEGDNRLTRLVAYGSTEEEAKRGVQEYVRQNNNTCHEHDRSIDLPSNHV